MARFLFFMVQIAVLVAAAVWLADHPGKVSVTWFDYQIDTSVGVLAVALIISFALLLTLLHLWSGFIHAPGAFFGRRTLRRRETGFQALSLGLAAVAAGDAEEARLQAKKASKLLSDPRLTQLLSAQAAALNGDQDAARNYFNALRNDSDTRYLGLAGLLRLALDQKDRKAALSLAREARELRPDSPLAIQTVFEQEARAGHWWPAQQALYDGVRRGVIAEPIARHHRSALLLERARQAQRDGNPDEALQLTANALQAVPDFVPAVCLQADLLAKAQKAKKAANVIETLWPTAPHPDLAGAYRRLMAEDEPLLQVKRMQKLTYHAQTATESRLAVAEAALAADLWGAARAQLDGIDMDQRSMRACRLFADLEEAEHGDAEAVRRWLRAAQKAPADPAWHCANCGAAQPGWQAICGNCGSFNEVTWKVPPNVARLNAPPTGAGPIVSNDPTEQGPTAMITDLTSEAAAAPPTSAKSTAS